MEEQQEIPAVAEHEAAMAEATEKREAALEKERVERVFGLTGGELNDRPWEPFAPKEGNYFDGDHYERESFRYWYDGAPSYASGFDDSEHTTVVQCIMFGSPPEVLYERGYRYEKVATYTTSGEDECPCAQDREEGHDVPGPCPLCETSADDDSHYIYIGDGWAEVVYRVVRVCEHCGGDFASLPPEYNVDERCTACNPLDLEVVVYLGNDVDPAKERRFYRGSSIAEAERFYAFALGEPRFQDMRHGGKFVSLAGAFVALYLDGDKVPVKSKLRD